MMETQLSEGRLDGASKNKWGLFEEDAVAVAAALCSARSCS